MAILMNQYELFCKKSSIYLGSHSSHKGHKKGDVLKFKGKYYIITDLIFWTERIFRANVWPAIIWLKQDLQDPSLLHWLQKNLVGLRISLVGDKKVVEGEVIDFWPGIRSISSKMINLDERKVTLFAEEFPDRIELLSLLSDDANYVDLVDYDSLQVLSK